MKQPTLVDVKPEPKLTPRQEYALQFLRARSHEGIRPVALGAMMHAYWSGEHPSYQQCVFCRSTGLELLRALRKKGFARQRRPRGLPAFWQATDLPPEQMGELPEGF